MRHTLAVTVRTSFLAMQQNAPCAHPESDADAGCGVLHRAGQAASKRAAGENVTPAR